MWLTLISSSTMGMMMDRDQSMKMKGGMRKRKGGRGRRNSSAKKETIKCSVMIGVVLTKIDMLPDASLKKNGDNLEARIASLERNLKREVDLNLSFGALKDLIQFFFVSCLNPAS